jgi:hypothetical protein
MQKNLFDWFWKKEIKFTVEEVQELIEAVKVFNAGAIDPYLTKHTDKVFEEWLKEKKKDS